MSERRIIASRRVAGFTRQTNTTSYGANEPMGDASTCILKFEPVDVGAGPGIVKSARLTKSAVGNTTNDEFRLILWSQAPSVDPADNGAVTTSWVKIADKSIYLGEIDFETLTAHADMGLYEHASLIPVPGIIVPGQTLYGMLIATLAYAPASAEVFQMVLNIEH